MESLDIKKHVSEKQISEDRRQVEEWLGSHPLTVIRGGAWYRGGECIKKARASEEPLKDWPDSPFNWR